MNSPCDTASLFSLRGLVAVVTGAGARGGIGHAIALGFSRAGAQLAIADCDAEGLATTAAELTLIGAPPLACACDIAEEADVERLFAAVTARYGRVDVLVNVPFSFNRRAAPHEIDIADWERAVAVNLTGYLRCCQHALRDMLTRGAAGSLINIGSNGGVGALGRGALIYGCSKAAVHQLTRELAVEYAASGIRCNALLPAQTHTPGLAAHLENQDFRDQVLPRMLAGLPQGRLLQPEDYVGPAIFLASAAAAAVNGVLL
ncbi:MAG TPA: SDR family oxidoreductase, partial [Rhodocyclaceae bacterium]